MDNSEEWVEIMDRLSPSSGNTLSSLYAPASGQYFSPIALAKLEEESENNFSNKVPLAIFDTGLLSGHSYIKGRIIDTVDFTGEGPEDQNGHGTLVSLLALAQNPSPVINVKVMDKTGRGKEEWLIQGLDWIGTWAKNHKQKVIANLSIGIFHRRFGILKCDGKCNLVAAAKRAEEAGVMLCLAAGNSGPNASPCPQLGALKGEFHGLVVAEMDPQTKSPAPHSGPGNIGAPTPSAAWHVC